MPDPVELGLEADAGAAPGRAVDRQGGHRCSRVLSGRGRRRSSPAFNVPLREDPSRPGASSTAIGLWAVSQASVRTGRMGRVPPADADAVLAGLDPEQRAVAHGPARPGVRAGRRRHRQDPGDHPPDRLRRARRRLSRRRHVLAVTFTARAAGEMRGRLRALGVGGVQARTFHAAALRQLRYFWPRVVGGELPAHRRAQGPAGRRGRRPAAARARTDRAARPRRRDRVGQGHPDRARGLPGRGGPGAAATPPLDLDAATMARGLRRPTRRSSAPRASSTSRTCCCSRSACSRTGRDVAEQVRGAVPALRRRRVPGRQPAPAAAAGAVARRPRRPVRGRRRQPDDLLLHRRLPDLPARLPAPLTRTPTVVRLVRDYRSTPQVVGLANRVLGRRRGASAAAAARAGRAAAAGPAADVHRATPTSRPRPRASPRAIRGADRRRASPASEIAVLFRINAQSEAYEQALADAGVPYVLRGGERFFERPEVRQAVLLLRGAARARRPTGRRAAGRGRATCSPPRLDRRDRRRPAARPGSAGRRWRRWSGWPRTSPPSGPDATLARPGRRARRAGRRPARADRRGRHPGLAARRQGPGVGRRVPGRAGRRAWCRSSTPRPPRHVEEERRLLYVGVTRAREHLSLSWSWARNPGGSRNELVDIETLNRRAFAGELELTALSLHAYAYLADKYILCTVRCEHGRQLRADGRRPRAGDDRVAPRQDDRRARHADDGVSDAANVPGQRFQHVVVPFDQILDVGRSGRVPRPSRSMPG